MKKLKSLFLTMLSVAVCAGFTACSDDDDNTEGSANEPNVTDVLPGGAPKSIGDYTFTTNGKGQVTQIADDDNVMTIEYGSFSRAVNYNALLTLREKGDPTHDWQAYMVLDNQGFVTDILQVYNNPADYDGKQSDTWKFTYDSDGHLIHIERSESGDVFNITYTDGNITKVEQSDADGDKEVNTITYINATFPTVVANIAGVMEFDEFFAVDMDEMSLLYYAGMLGKPTKNLPMGRSYVQTMSDGTVYNGDKTYNWKFYGNNYPDEFSDGSDPWDVIKFVW